MRTIYLKSSNMLTKKQVHKYFKKVFDLPEYYGNNLDALWDVLTERIEETKIVLDNEDLLMENLSEYGESIIELFEDLSNDYDNYSFEIRDQSVQ